MIIFLYGQNSYSLIQYVRELIDRYQKKYPDSFNLHRFDLEETDIAEIENVIKGVSFFKEVKFVIVENPFAKATLLEKTIKDPSTGSGRETIAKEKDSVLLLYQSEPEEELKKKGQKLFELLKKESQTKEFKPITAPVAAKFAAAWMAKNKTALKKDLLAKLLKETGPDLWRLENELRKISAYSKQEKRTITDKELVKLANFKMDYNIFAITDAAFFDHSSAMRLLDDFFLKGGDPSYLISMFAFQLKNLIMVRELIDPEAEPSARYGAGKKLQYSEILKKTKMHPFVFKKNYETAKKYTLDQLKSLFRKLAEFEVSLKSGRSQAEDIFFKVFL